jgi:ABC-type nickel/cobalt efflux system permease component RcnA
MRRLLLAFAIAAGLLAGPALAPAQAANPFTGERDRVAEETAPAAPAWGPLAVVGRALLTFQREANQRIALHMRAIRDGETSLQLLIGLALAFTYGVVHALGPGHGKFVVVAYFMAREARIARGLLMGLQIAVFHVISAMAVVALADLVLRQAFGGPPAEVAGLRLVSYGLIAAIGLVMLAQAVRRSRARRAGIEVAACCGRSHDGQSHEWPVPHDHHHHGAAREKAQQGALSLGVGLVPCTGAILILLYAMANDILYAGMLLVGAIAAGMAITMGALGLLSVIARRAVAARLEVTGGSRRFTVAMDYAGALAVTLIGSTLLWAVL